MTGAQKFQSAAKYSWWCTPLQCRMARGNNQSREKKSGRGKKIARNLARRYPPSSYYPLISSIRPYPRSSLLPSLQQACEYIPLLQAATLWYQISGHIIFFTANIRPYHLLYSKYEVKSSSLQPSDIKYMNMLPSCHHPLTPISPALSNTTPWPLR